MTLINDANDPSGALARALMHQMVGLPRPRDTVGPLPAETEVLTMLRIWVTEGDREDANQQEYDASLQRLKAAHESLATPHLIALGRTLGHLHAMVDGMTHVAGMATVDRARAGDVEAKEAVSRAALRGAIAEAQPASPLH